MSLQIIKPLPQQLLCKNPATLSFLKKGIYESDGSYADVKFSLDWASLGSGATWVLEWNNKSITITFETAYTESPYIVLEYATGAVEDYLANHLIPALNSIEALVDDFIIESNAYTGSSSFFVRFKAKYKGSQYQIATAISSTITVNSTITLPGNAPALLENYKVKLKVAVEDNSNTNYFNEIAALEATGFPNEQANEMQIDFYDLPALLANYNFIKLPKDAYQFVLWSNLFSKFKIQYAEVYGAIPETKKLKNLFTQPATALPFGIALTHANVNDWWASFTNNTPLKFLTFQPQKKLISIHQPEWLLFNANTSIGTFTHIRIGLRFNESPNTSFTINWNNDWNNKQVLIPVGFKQLGLASYETATKKVISYSVMIYETDVINTRSETREYVIDPRSHRDEKYIVFFNSLMGIDTIRLTGAQQLQTETEQDVIEILHNDETTAYDGTMQVSNKTYRNGFSANTGFLQKQDVDYFIELLKAEHIWLCGAIPDKIEDRSVYAMPFQKVILEGKKYNRHTTNQFLWSYDLDFANAWEDNNYTSGTLPSELLFDDYFEITVENTDGENAYYIELGSTGAYNNQYFINGNLQDATGDVELFDISPQSIAKIIYKAKNINNIHLVAETTSLKITFNYLPLPLASTINIENFRDLKAEYFMGRLREASKLTDFYCENLFNQRDVDLLLKELVEVQSNYGNLNNVDVLGATPTAAGYIDKDKLIASGVTTNTD